GEGGAEEGAADSDPGVPQGGNRAEPGRVAAEPESRGSGGCSEHEGGNGAGGGTGLLLSGTAAPNQFAGRGALGRADGGRSLPRRPLIPPPVNLRRVSIPG